jgi:hypothetical protein
LKALALSTTRYFASTPTMFPYGKKDRPIYPGASPAWAKENCGLVPFDFPSFGL